MDVVTDLRTKRGGGPTGILPKRRIPVPGAKESRFRGRQSQCVRSFQKADPFSQEGSKVSEA